MEYTDGEHECNNSLLGSNELMLLLQGFIPLPKSVTKSRIEENAQIYDFELTAEEMKSLDTGVYEPCAWDPTVSHD